jgi:hypothetical protein
MSGSAGTGTGPRDARRSTEWQCRQRCQLEEQRRKITAAE